MTSGRRIAALFLMAGVMIVDGYDLNAMAIALRWLAPEMGLEPTAFAIVQSADLLGLGAGAFLIAPFGDRIGRKPLIVGGILAVAIATAATPLSSEVSHFALWRLLTGLGLGACLANVSALSSEIAPEGRRSTVMAVVSAGIAIGAMAAGFSAPELVSMGGWQALFFLPASLALALGLLLAAVLPGGKPAGRSKGARAPLIELTRPPLLFPMAMFAAVYMINAIALYMLTRWAVRVLPEDVFGPDLPSRLQGLMQGAGLPISIALAWLLDKWRPGPVLTLGYAVIAAAFVMLFLTPAAVPSWVVLLMIGGGGIAGIHGALMALTPKLFPSTVLSSAIGTAVAVSRLGAIAAPIFGATLIDGGISPGGYFGVLAIPAILCCLLTLLIPRAIAAGRSFGGASPAPAGQNG